MQCGSSLHCCEHRVTQCCTGIVHLTDNTACTTCAHTYCWLCSNSTNRHVVWPGNASLEQRIDGFSSHTNWNSADSSKHVIGRDRGAQDSQQGRLIRFIGQLPWCSNTDTPTFFNPVNVRHDQLMNCNWSSAGCFIHKHMENCSLSS